MKQDEARNGKAAVRGILAGAIVMLLAGTLAPVLGQQFNSDNYWTAPHGVGTFVLTGGQHYSTILATAALFPKWEFTIGETLYEKDEETNSDHHYTLTIYVKRMMYENESKTGGWAIMGGTGLYPGYLAAGTVTNSFRSYWVSAPVTIPFFKGALSWDLMPGATVNLGNASDSKSEWGFTYSTRLAVYKVVPQSAIVGEVFGTEGDAYSKPQYKVGIRWEPNTKIVVAASYGACLDGSPGAGFEIGVMFFTRPFLRLGK